MKRSNSSEDQIAFALKQSELGTSVQAVCRKMGISDATFYVWRKIYQNLGPSKLRRLRQLEEENRKLNLLKRQTCGRASFEQLRRRILLAV